MLNYLYKDHEPGTKERIVDRALNGSGIRDTARVLGISKNTGITAIKKAPVPVRVNPSFVPPMNDASEREVSLGRLRVEAEADGQWSYVREKSNQRWLWYAVDHANNTMLTYTFGQRRDKVFKELKAPLEPLGIRRYYTDDWGAYERYLEAEKHEVGKRNTKKIERKNLNG